MKNLLVGFEIGFGATIGVITAVYISKEASKLLDSREDNFDKIRNDLEKVKESLDKKENN